MSKGVLALAAAFVLVGASAARARQGGEVVAMVQEVSGTVLIREAGSKEQRALHVRRDRGRAVHAGQSFKCEKGGSLRLRVGRESKVFNGPTPWFTVEPDTSAPARYKEALNEYANTGGRSRGSEPPFFSPANNGAVAPASFVIRWNPKPQARGVTLTIRDEEGDVLWRQESVDAGAGSLAPEEARRALGRYREAGGGSLTLHWADESGDSSKVTFVLLSAKDEEAMNAALAGWQSETDTLVRHLGRAYVYSVNWVLDQAADEYEAALKLAPESHDLLSRAARAQRDSGNFTRAVELEGRLKTGDDPR